MSKSPEKELEEFLEPLDAYVRKACENRWSSFTADEMEKLVGNRGYVDDKIREYNSILQRIPEKLSENDERGAVGWIGSTPYSLPRGQPPRVIGEVELSSSGIQIRKEPAKYSIRSLRNKIIIHEYKSGRPKRGIFERIAHELDKHQDLARDELLQNWGVADWQAAYKDPTTKPKFKSLCSMTWNRHQKGPDSKLTS